MTNDANTALILLLLIISIMASLPPESREKVVKLLRLARDSENATAYLGARGSSILGLFTQNLDEPEEHLTSLIDEISVLI